MHQLGKAVLVVLLAMFLGPADLASQQLEPATRPADRVKKSNTVKLEPWVSLEGEYDNNIFLLSPSRKRAVSDPSAADLTSGRFTGMESADDIVVQARGGVGVELAGIGGRAFTLAPALQYDYYSKNNERSHLTASVSLAQALARGMRTRLDLSYTPSYFAKNYLLGASDANNDRSIAPGERLYAPGEYSALDVELTHRLRLRKSTKRSPLGVELDVGVGYYSRAYDEPFASRDLGGPSFRSTVGIAPGSGMELTLGYDLEMLSADAGEEVLILDEADAGRDLNGNGNATDVDVRTVQLVDRSRREHELSAGVRFDVTRRTDLRVKYGLRFRNYSSEEPLDLGHRDRRDTRHELRGELSRRLARGVRFSTGARYARQTTNRLFDPDQTDEADDYSRLRGFAGLRVEF